MESQTVIQDLATKQEQQQMLEKNILQMLHYILFCKLKHFILCKFSLNNWNVTEFKSKKVQEIGFVHQFQQFLFQSTEGGNRAGCILKAGLHLGPDCGLWAICPVSMEMTYQLENKAPRRKSPRALQRPNEHPNYLCNRIESYILLCLLGYDHRPIDNCPLWTN